MKDNIEFGEFSSYRTGRHDSRLRLAKYRAQRHTSAAHGGSMTAKIAICIGICLLVIVGNVVARPLYMQATGQTEDAEKKPGQLRFVELPGLLEVFAGGDDFTIPINYTEAVVSEDRTTLRLSGKSGGMVTTSREGIVKNVGIDEKLGLYVSVKHDNDVVTCFYGLAAVTVDASQPIQKLDTLGVLDETGIMFMRIFVGGEPVDPTEYINITASVGII